MIIDIYARWAAFPSRSGSGRQVKVNKRKKRKEK